ncbi:MAG: polyamine aminopropyltransferase [Alphaproteobacteria bacterium]
MSHSFTETLHHGWSQSHQIVGELIADEKTAFQHVQIFDTPLFGRVMALDGIVQITEHDEAAYSEMLAHLPIFELGTVKRVMIVGGGDGAIAEEILKHPEIEAVDLVDIDGRVIELCQTHFGAVHNGVFDDARLHVHAIDAFDFLNTNTAKGRYDLIIADRPDPVGPAEILFQNNFYALVRAALTPQGVAVFQTGVPQLQAQELADAVTELNTVFDQTGTYLTVTPTYVGGFMALTWASRGAVLGNSVKARDIADRFAVATFATQYYSPEIHFAAFALPPFIKRLVKNAEANPRG